MSLQAALTGWRQKLPTKKAALRELLADGRWHSQGELTRRISHRFGDVIFRAHKDAEPLHHQRQVDAVDDSIYHYRAAPSVESCWSCTALRKESHRERADRLEEECAALRCEVARLNGLLR